jgi:hypothetical protein
MDGNVLELCPRVGFSSLNSGVNLQANFRLANMRYAVLLRMPQQGICSL